MADTSAGPAPRKRGRWLRWLGIIAGALVVLLVIAYFVVTSAGFLKGVILPKASAALNAQITVADASISPFSRLELRGLKVQTTGPEPLVTARDAVVRYRLLDFLGGNYKIQELTLTAPVVNLVENPDGSSNLDPLLKSQKQPPPPKEEKKTPSKPLQIELRQLTLTEGTIRRTVLHPGGGRDLVEVAPLNLKVANVKNGQTGTLELAANLLLDQHPPAPATNAMLQAKLAGKFSFGLTAELRPDAVKGNARLEVQKAGGSMAQIGALVANLDCDATPKEIKQIALRFQKNNTGLGEIRASGPFDVEKTEGRLNVAIMGIDKQVLNLAGGPLGIDFNSTVINATNQIELSKNANVIAVAGQLNVDQFSVTRTNQTTPPLNLSSVFNVSVDRPQQTALLRELTLNGAQNQRPLLLARLAQPMSVAWGNTAQSVPDSAFNLTVTNLNLADWQAFVGEAAPAGTANLTLDVVSRNSGKLLTFDCASLVDQLTAKFGSNQISQSTVRLRARGQVEEMKRVNLAESRFELARQNQSALTAGATGLVQLDTKDADLQVTLDGALARLLELAPQPNVSVSAGTATLKAHVIQKGMVQTATGTLGLANFTGGYGTNTYANLGAALDFDLTKQNEQVQIRKAAGALRQGTNPAANFEVSGTAVLSTNQQADLQVALDASLPQLLQIAPQPDLKASSGTAQIKAHVVQQGKAQSVTGTLGLANFTGNFREYQLEAFGAAFDLDTTLQDQLLQLRKFSGALTAANQPAGRFDLKGSVGLTNQAGQVELSLADLNQNALRPFLAPSLGDKKLVSASLNATASVQYDLQRESAIKADAQLTNLVVSDPQRRLPAVPLEAKLKLDAALKQKLIDIRQGLLALTPTPRARNALELKGQVDMSQTNALEGALKLAAESIDVTPYYDLFASNQGTNAPAQPAPPAPAPAQPAAAPTAPPAESPPMTLPIKNFTLDTAIGQFYLRHVALTNLQAGLKLGPSNVNINPLQVLVNGGPVNGTIALNLGVPGYAYDINLKGAQVPLAPLADSFAADYKGRAKGDLGWNIQIQGAGTTGASLQKSLQGRTDFTLTNASVVVVTGTNKIARFMRTVLQPLARGLRLPELVESPLTYADARVGLGEGKVNLEQLRLDCDAFVASTQGSIPIASQLTNSPLPNLPVNLAIKRTLLQKINLVPRDTPPDAQFVQLPALYHVGGTVGAPDAKFDAVAFGVFAARIASGLPALQGGGAGKILGGFTDLLGGNKSTNAPGTNAPAGTGNQLLQGLKGILNKGGSATTNAPGTNAPAGTGSQLMQGLQGLLGGNRSATNAAATNAPATNRAFNPLDLFKR